MASFLVTLVIFVTQAIVWSRLAITPVAPPDPSAILRAFAQEDAGLAVDVSGLYRNRQDLLDPRAALPTWHRADRSEAVQVYGALARCPAARLDPRPTNVALDKAYNWHAATCTGGVPENVARMFTEPPFMHPSGRSYAALALALGAKPSPRDFHVLELSELDRTVLSPDDRALADLPATAWTALMRGDTIVLTHTALAIAEQGSLGLSRLHIHARSAWDRHALRYGVLLTERAPAATCERPGSPDLCWEPLAVSTRFASLRTVTTTTSLVLLAAGAIVLAVTVMRERRRAHTERIHVLRTLTHELRTPATSLKLDIVPLRRAYDGLPLACQEPLLRLSDSIERLHRVMHRSARYMALFETPGAPRNTLLKLREVASMHELFEGFADEWPDGATVSALSEDRAVVTDPEWLGVAVRNLVENAVRHGKPPVNVTWSVSGDALVVRVADRGSSPSFSLRRATNPFERSPQSEGLGLGLAIVAKVAELFGGRLTHEPTPTAFELRLPLSRGRP